MAETLDDPRRSLAAAYDAAADGESLPDRSRLRSSR
jgi:hypothetical protein